MIRMKYLVMLHSLRSTVQSVIIIICVIVDCVPGDGLFLPFVLDNETEADFITLINYTFISRLIFQTLLGDIVIYDMPQEKSFNHCTHCFQQSFIYTYISITGNIELL